MPKIPRYIIYYDTAEPGLPPHWIVVPPCTPTTHLYVSWNPQLNVWQPSRSHTPHVLRLCTNPSHRHIHTIY